MSVSRTIGVILLAGTGVAVSAQRPQPPAAQPAFRATTTYVALDVLVTDARNRTRPQRLGASC